MIKEKEIKYHVSIGKATSLTWIGLIDKKYQKYPHDKVRRKFWK